MKKIYGDISGGLGNLLFDCAHLYTTGKKLNIPVEYYLRKDLIFKDKTRGTQMIEYEKNGYNHLFSKLNIQVSEIPITEYTTSIKNFCTNVDEYLQYDTITLKDCWPDFTDLDNKEMRDLFCVNEQYRSHFETKFANLLSLPNKVSIHVRRGDYLWGNYVNLLDNTNYYQTAINELPKDSNFIVISDCIEDCKHVFKGKNFFFMEKNTSLQDFLIQTYCQTNICANSTFSYWAAFLNKNDNQNIIIPKSCNYKLTKNNANIIQV